MRQSKALHSLLYVILGIGSVVTVIPFVWMMLSAFKQPDEIVAYPPVWIPTVWTLHNFVRVWTELRFERFFANSVFVASVVTAAVLYTSALCGFVLAKYQFRGRDTIFLAMLATMMVPWPVTLIPSYLTVIWLKLINTHWALIVPGIYSTFGVFLMRQYMHSVPEELLDAARIDGAAEIYIFHGIVIPLVRPALAALGIFTFLGNWDSFIWPLIVIKKEALYTLPMGMSIFTGRWYTDNGAVMAGTAISVLPVLLVYIALQRQIVEGVTLTGLKV